ncbi:hypothetical protein AVEN_128102-1 [Araneus ventricosus]|uniref:Uncharacterized protein n=1 Tax=Araneus ventricosus TaxID=182803 RepID=A0A4Y2A1M7_ARAVE|nr:hypothetical protein AVEN_128102-1 [Araneus ventricosus]
MAVKVPASVPDCCRGVGPSKTLVLQLPCHGYLRVSLSSVRKRVIFNLRKGYIGTELVIMDFEQITKTIPYVAHLSPNFHTTPRGGLLTLVGFNAHQARIHGSL